MRELDVERLLRWAYRDELPKRGVVGTLSNQWDNVSGYGELLAIVDDEVRLPAVLGPPHDDALKIERAVHAMPTRVRVEWNDYGPLLMGDLIWLMPKINPIGERTYSERALLETFAKQGARPLWDVGHPSPQRMLGKNNKPVLVGECYGPGRYSIGSSCPLQYTAPTIEQLVHRRLEWVMWRGALDRVCDALKTYTLQDYVPLRSTAPRLPWLDGPAPVMRELPITTPAFRTWADEPKRQRARQRR